MVICICAGKTEKDVRCAIRADCKTLRELREKYNIGKDCCVCVAAVQQLLKEEVK